MMVNIKNNVLNFTIIGRKMAQSWSQPLLLCLRCCPKLRARMELVCCLTLTHFSPLQANLINYLIYV